MVLKRNHLFFVVIVFVFLSGCVEPGQFVALETKVAVLEMENSRQLSVQKEKLNASALLNQNNQLKIEALEKRLSDSATISQEEYAELKYTIQTLKEGLQRLEGQIEEIKHGFEGYYQKNGGTMEEKIERLDQAISKNYERAIKLEIYIGFEPSAAGEIDKTIQPAPIPGKSPAQELYDAAKKLFDDGDNENARIQFENFINKYPDSDNADNARFWIADSYYVEKWFEKAILEYQKVLEGYPNSNKLSAARLKQGYAFAELGEEANARLILKELIKNHPGTNEARYAQEKIKTLK
ncbi:MAG: tol-pal system protein YbgF [Desulfobacula sp.]|nr:tol-pal system protein YbgF [Desulfobacula sp.]